MQHISRKFSELPEIRSTMKTNLLNVLTLDTVIFFTQKIAKTVSSVQPAKLTQFQVMTPAKGVKRPEKLKKGQKNFEGQIKGPQFFSSNIYHFISIFGPNRIHDLEVIFLYFLK